MGQDYSSVTQINTHTKDLSQVNNRSGVNAGKEKSPVDSENLAVAETDTSQAERIAYCLAVLESLQTRAEAQGFVRLTTRQLQARRQRQNRLEYRLQKEEVIPESERPEMLHVIEKVPDYHLLLSSPGVDNSASKRKQPVMLGATLNKYLELKGFTLELSKAKLKADWANIVGEELAQHVWVEKIEKRIVYLRCSSTSWASSLRMLTPQLMEKIERYSGTLVLEKIIVNGPDAPSWKHGKYSVPGRGPRDTYG